MGSISAGIAKILNDKYIAVKVDRELDPDLDRRLIPIAKGKWVIPDMVLYSPMTLWLEVALEFPGLDPAVRDPGNARFTLHFYDSFIMLRASNAS